MRIRARIAVSIAFLALGVCSFGLAQAQSPASAPPAASSNTSGGLARVVTLSTDDMRKQGDAVVSKLDLHSSTVRKMLESAREQREVVKTLCLSDRLTQIDVTVRSAKERRDALEAAATRKDNELSAHEFQVLSVYGARGDRLLGEANACVGSEVGFIGDTRVNATVDPAIPTGEGGLPAPNPPGSPVIVPPPASCVSCAL